MIAVTGATGQLGKLIVEQLLVKMPAAEVIAVVRDPQKAQALAQRGVQIRKGDYSNQENLTAAFAGAEKVLFVSSNDLGYRVPQHQAVTNAAVAARVKLLAYTSILNADTSALLLAQEHQPTEAYIRTSGVPFTFLRNGWYTENQTQALGAALAHGAILGAARDGRFSAAARADYAAAAVAVLTGDGHENKVYELGGDESYTLTDLAAEVARQSKKTVIYQDLPQQEYAGALIGFGLPEGLAGALADADAGASRGQLYTRSRDLSELIGRATTTMQESVTAALPGPDATLLSTGQTDAA